MNDENLIKVQLPGECLWAAVTGTTAGGRIKAVLRNESIHGIPWDTAVVLGRDDYTVVEPEAVVQKAQRSVDAIRKSFKSEAQ